MRCLTIRIFIFIFFASFSVRAEAFDREYARKNGPRIYAINDLFCANPLEATEIVNMGVLDSNEQSEFYAAFKMQKDEILKTRMQNALDLKSFQAPDCEILRAMKRLVGEALTKK